MCLKDISGDNVTTAVSYLKGALMLLQNCDAIPTNMTGLLNDIMMLADCDEFTEYMKSIYFASKRKKTSLASFTSYLNTARSKYRTLYRTGKWKKSEADPDFGFMWVTKVKDGVVKTKAAATGDPMVQV